MRRSTIIATCLVNSNMVNQIEGAEHKVQQIFRDEFPEEDFAAWNREVGDETAATIIRKIGRASRINVRMFIDELRR
ncbi:hypothetical protein [Longimicrobium sp.]|uniref:hypothetical protein n=1 Tax=Longimicrobium sp. TaxID=2029185 RepID=UPI002E363102|nr:hypothetical protein [Longimicrobium sp.]HEX6038555.1 hypothetical protein [Longimicrobium sp.]